MATQYGLLRSPDMEEARSLESERGSSPASPPPQWGGRKR